MESSASKSINDEFLTFNFPWIFKYAKDAFSEAADIFENLPF